MFYKYTTSITYITESGRKKNKQARTWINPEYKKGEVLTLFWHSVAIASVYPKEIPTQLPGTLTHSLALSDQASGSISPNSTLQQPPLSNRHLSLTVVNSSLFCSVTLLFLVFFRSHRKFRAQALCVGFAPKQTKESSDWRSPTPIERMPTLVLHKDQYQQYYIHDILSLNISEIKRKNTQLSPLPSQLGL